MARQSQSVDNAPQPIHSAGGTLLDTETLVTQSKLTQVTNEINKKLGDTNSLTTLVVLVLFLGFITLLAAVIGIIIQFWGFNANIQSDLTRAINEQTKSTNQQTENVNKFNLEIEILKRTISPPSPSPSSLNNTQ